MAAPVQRGRELWTGLTKWLRGALLGQERSREVNLNVPSSIPFMLGKEQWGLQHKGSGSSILRHKMGMLEEKACAELHSLAEESF